MSVLEGNRDVNVNFSDEVMPVDAMKAALRMVEKHEAAFAADSNTPDIGTIDEATLSNSTAVKTILTGATPYKVHVFDVYADVSAPVYVFDYVETVPNAESVS